MGASISAGGEIRFSLGPHRQDGFDLLGRQSAGKGHATDPAVETAAAEQRMNHPRNAGRRRGAELQNQHAAAGQGCLRRQAQSTMPMSPRPLADAAIAEAAVATSAQG